MHSVDAFRISLPLVAIRAASGPLVEYDRDVRSVEPERFKGTYLIARSEADAPDIDGRVYIRAPAAERGLLALRGGFSRVKIVAHTDYDLIAQHG